MSGTKERYITDFSEMRKICAQAQLGQLPDNTILIASNDGLKIIEPAKPRQLLEGELTGLFSNLMNIHWKIPTENMPDDEELVLVFCEEKDLFYLAWHDSELGTWLVEHEGGITGVTHWKHIIPPTSPTQKGGE